MRCVNKSVLAVAALLMGTVPAFGQEFSLPLIVREPANVERAAASVSGGIPLPAGRFDKDQQFALFENGREVPLQTQPLVVDPAGKLRWVLLDFQTSLSAKQQKTFTLKAVSSKAAPAKPLKVAETAEAVSVETGEVAFTVSKTKPFGLFDAVSSGGRPVVVGGRVSYTDAFDGAAYLADKPASVVVEYAGPLRTTIAVKGRFVGDDKNKLGYVARITAWAGRGDVHVKYSLTNSNPTHYSFRLIKDSTVELNLASPARGATVGGASPVDVGPDGSLIAGLKLRTPGAVKAFSGTKDVWTSAGGKNEAVGGWLAVKTAAEPVCVTDLYFCDDPCRKLAVAGDKLRLTGVTERFETAKDARGRMPAAPHLEMGRWILDCSHLSSQYAIDFSAAGDADRFSAAAKAPLHVLAEPAWYFETESLFVGRFGTQADELACYDTWGWKYDKNRVPAKPGMNMGRYIKDLDNHFESEQDSLDALCLMYLRTGSRAFLDQAVTWANYHMDTQAWRTNGWQWKDGGVWWMKGNAGPIGNRPQRAADPVTGVRHHVRNFKIQKETEGYCRWLVDSKRCYCHNWGEGLADWYCLTGDRDALEALVDNVEQDYNWHKGKVPGKSSSFSRDFNRSCQVASAARMVMPTDPFIIEVSDFLAECYMARPNREPRGLVNGAGPIGLHWCNGDIQKVETWFKGFVGEQGMAEMKRLGITIDPTNGQLTDPKTGTKWFPLPSPHTWMFPPLSRGMEAYYRATGNEDVADWLIAYGQAVSHVLYQPRHGNLAYGKFMVDFPLKGVCNDFHTWMMAPDAKMGEGVAINGYLAQFYPDVAARAYELCGEETLKQRAHDYWKYGSHRGYFAKQYFDLNSVVTFANVYGQHSESVCFTGKTFYVWSHPRKDATAPKAVTDLKVTASGGKATVSFTAPADAGGKAVRYQVKCSDKPIVAYEDFLKAWAANTDAGVTNWWMASNVAGEPAPGAAGSAEKFVVSVPADAKYFAISAFDDSNNRSAISNVAQVGQN